MNTLILDFMFEVGIKHLPDDQLEKEQQKWAAVETLNGNYIYQLILDEMYEREKRNNWTFHPL